MDLPLTLLFFSFLVYHTAFYPCSLTAFSTLPCLCVCLCVLITQLCPTLCDPMDCSWPNSSVHEIFQARILEWVAIPFFRGSSWLRDWTWVSYIAGRFFTVWATTLSIQSLSHTHCSLNIAGMVLPQGFVASVFFAWNILIPHVCMDLSLTFLSILFSVTLLRGYTFTSLFKIALFSLSFLFCCNFITLGSL